MPATLEPAVSTVPDARGRFGPFGGRYVPETLMFALDQLDAAYRDAQLDPTHRKQLVRIGGLEVHWHGGSSECRQVATIVGIAVTGVAP